MARRTTRRTAAPLTASCTECQRRKQKCSRDWPCSHCQTRRLPHLCRFVPRNLPRTSKQTANQNIGQSRSLESHDGMSEIEQTGPHGLDMPVTTIAPEFRKLGYQVASLGINGPEDERTEFQRPSSLEMDNALHTLPPKPYTDILVQHFLRHNDYYYCCLYPQKFSDDYSRWWADRASGKNITPELTCLILRVCACSAQFLDASSQEKFELEIGMKTQCLAEIYHRAAQQLSNTIFPGQGGLVQVQQLFLTAAWLKGEGMFVDSWHALAAAVHAAQELGMHSSSSETMVTEFDREMRRRVWCPLYIWDWQMSALLSRPLIINDSCCLFELPKAHMENPDSRFDMPSPIYHTILQCQLRLALSKTPGLLAGASSPVHADAIQQEIERWFASIPSPYRVADTDTQWDYEYRYVALQRYQLHVVGYMTMLCPLKSCLALSSSSDKPGSEWDIKERAVTVSLKLMDALQRLFKPMYSINPKSHFVTFLIFDTASFLCSAVIHNNDHSLPRRGEVIQAIGLAVGMMRKLHQHTKGAATCYSILCKLVANLALSSQERTALHFSSTPNTDIQPGTSEAFNHEGIPSDDILTPDVTPCLEEFASGVDNSTLLDFPVPEADGFETANLSDIANMDLGELGQIWNWEDLGLNL